MSLSVSKSVQPSPRNRCEIEKVRIQMSLSVSKSVLPSPRNRCEFENLRIFRLSYLNRYISGTGSVRQMTSKLDQWPDMTFQMSLSVSKSVQPSPRNRCEKIDRPKGAHTHTHIHTHTHTYIRTHTGMFRSRRAESTGI